jgi:hypothetical protein
MKVRDVFVPAKKSKPIDSNIFIQSNLLTLVLERTLFDGSNESDNRGDVTISVGVVGWDNKKSKC